MQNHSRSIVVVSKDRYREQIKANLPPSIQLREVGHRGNTIILVADHIEGEVRVAKGEVPSLDVR